MKAIDRNTAIAWLKETPQVTFLTGAGVSTASGVPDYRSLTGVYQGEKRPEYLLSRTCLHQEPEKFYTFVKTLYHPKAQPNVIHKKMAGLERKNGAHIVSQNIDGLHRSAGSRHVVDFHGSLYQCWCQKCQRSVAWQSYLQSDRHDSCGGQVRPAITLYEEALDERIVAQAIEAVTAAALLVIVGTSFQVHPFCDLIDYARSSVKILVINQTPLANLRQAYFLQENAVTVFEQLNLEEG